ncbi:thiolase [Neoconidiobolus thromboides FSU 785]|nr:thiolase [Neoconidiobolus thromboides FSU 785]
MASQRLNQISNQLSTKNATKVGHKSGDDVVIIAALRTPITRARKGGFKDTHIEDLLSAVFKAVIQKSKIDPKIVEDIAVGNVLTGTAATMSRMASLHAGIPDSVPIYSVNRQCSSGLQAVAAIASSIQANLIDVGIAAGVESMTMHYGAQAQPTSISEAVNSTKQAAESLLPMGITSENVAKEFKVSREKQDKFAATSHQKAALAQKNGYFDEEIIPVETIVLDKEGNEKKVTITKDDGIRPETTFETLNKLKPAFSKDGFTTAGNASQVSDGAAAVLLMRRSKAEQLKLPILGKYVSSAVVGVPPHIMGVGPAYAIPAAAKKAGVQVQDIEIVELNEAFASQAVYSIEKLGLDYNKVNPKGGAIALGHPLGCTGARQVATLFPELKRQNKKLGAISMCIGTGMGMAAIFERE